MQSRLLILSFVALSWTAPVIPSALAKPNSSGPAVPTLGLKAKRLQGGGGWGRSRRTAADQRWQVDLERLDGNRIQGRVTLGRSPLASRGNLLGEIEGSRVFGSITDDGGRLIARFDGTVAADGIRGSYTDRTGEVGEWSWDGALPR